jgi:2-iminoacetate synthase
VRAGVDGLTVFQETYDPALYAELHPAGPKRDFAFRLDAPQRGAEAGMRVVNIGALLGLADWRREVFPPDCMRPGCRSAIPRWMWPCPCRACDPTPAGFPGRIVSDRELVQAMTALRIFLPRLSITISTREAPQLSRQSSCGSA